MTISELLEKYKVGQLITIFVQVNFNFEVKSVKNVL